LTLIGQVADDSIWPGAGEGDESMSGPVPPGQAVSLGRRESQIERLRALQFDLAVVGGGITGAGIALDAASRGLKVALIEKGDFASGTSSRSTKLIHGGLRYLAQMRFRLTREALVERSVLQRLAPHLVQPIPFLFPIYHRRLEVWRVNTGLWLYDLLAGLRRTRFHRQLSRDEVLRRAPGLRAHDLRAGFVYYDAQTDDARLVIEVLKAAVSHGAVVVNYVAAERILTADGRAFGLIAHDVLDDRDFEIRARKIVLATGVWLDEVLNRDRPGAPRRVRPAKGVHLIVPRDRLDLQLAVVFPTPDDRLMFVIPWLGATLIGTTDTDYQGPLDEPRATRADLDYLLGVVNAAFPEAHLTDDDVISVQAGLRPLIDTGESTTAAVSREDRIFENADGTIGIAGGKLTTYRRMGRKAVDLVVSRLLDEGVLRRRLRSRTGSLPIGGYPARRRFGRLGRFIRRRRGDAAPSLDGGGVAPEIAQRLWQRYGANWQAVVELIADNRALGQRVVPEQETLAAEVVFAVRHEMARTLLDVLARRTHVALFDRHQGRTAAPAVARLMAYELGWDDAETARQIAEFATHVEQFSVDPLRRSRVEPEVER
jgi:glycerol-3-phosphate dehydrogenase